MGTPGPVSVGIHGPTRMGIPEQVSMGIPEPVCMGVPQPVSTGAPGLVSVGIPGPVIRPCDVAIVSSSPQGMTSWSSSIKIWFLQAYGMHYLKLCDGVKQNTKICAIGETEHKNMCHW